MKKNPFISVITIHHFRNLWLAQITSQIALNMLSFVLAIHVYQTTQSNTAVSLLLLTFSIPAAIFGVIAGGIVDIFDKRDILFYCNLTRFFLFFTFFIFSHNVFAIYFIAIIFSLVTQLFIPAEVPTIPLLVSKSLLLTANSLFTVSFYLSTILGFVLSGPMLKIFGSSYVFLLMAALMGLASVFISFLPKRMVEIKLSFIDIGKAIDEGLQYIKSSTRVTQSLFLATFTQVLIMTLVVLAPGFADKVLNIELTDASYLIMGPAAIGLVIGAMLVGEYGNKFLKGTLIRTGIISTGIILILSSLLTSVSDHSIVLGNLIFAFLLLFLLGFFNSFISVPANTILQQDSYGAMRGRIYGILTSMTSGISALPIFFSGVIADVVGVSRTLLLIGTITFIIGAYNWWQRIIEK
ncbi:MFS transporter [Candidatus Gottesmanbacteria bacterium]|nr:MFS transporter [Candidatus Gottesmanbacteria bacterium]